MELQHLNVKIYVQGELKTDLERIIESFHRWTSQQVMDELLIDVADYRHVPHGPGVVLVGHEADYAIDNAQGRWGMLYNRRAGLDGSNADRLAQAFHAVSKACSMLESEFDDLKFSRQEFEIFVNDRAHAPNTPETLAACKADLSSFLDELIGANSYEISPESDPRRRFGVNVQASSPFKFPALA